jgi:3-oxoacyl-[acyl-carrier protein] reductase
MTTPSSDDGHARYPDLQGRVVVVTGGTKGIGLATAELLARNGGRVVVNGRDEAYTDRVAAELRDSGHDVLGVAADVSSIAGLRRLREATLEQFGAVHGLAAFAGGFGARTPFDEITEDEWNTVIHQNLTSTFFALQAFLPAIRDAGGGAVVTMASNAARLLDLPLTASYAAAKAGVVMMTRHVAREYGSAGIRVNCIAPATTLSPRVERVVSEEARAEIARMSPLGRIGIPEDSANATVFLLSDAAAWLTGVTLDVAGGRVML